MSTVTENDAEEVIEYEDYIDQQIATTSFHVKTVDLVSGLVLLALAVLGIAFAIVMVDHWIVGLNFAARVASLVSLIGVAVGLFVWKVIPPLFLLINPDYSAQAVERSFPTLNNSLVNFLFFRERTDQLKSSVYDGIKQQAATGLYDVPIDSAVDRSPIIRLGYALVAITVIWVGYFLLSPKSPVQTLQRIATPWRQIQRPSKVDISEVSPGDVDVFRGQTVEVKAKIAGLKEDQIPAIEFSTSDGQLLNQTLPMQQDGAAGHYVGTLTLGESGIEQDLNYRVVAGDAHSPDFIVRSVESPHIVVDRIEYDFPAYTGITDEVIQGDGDIRAIEGTRVTIHGNANQPMRRGYLELLPAVDPTTPPADYPASKQASMTIGGNDREGGMVRLTMRLDETKKPRVPLYRGYRLHFTNDQDLASADAIEHAIEVVADLRPIVQILTPSKRTIDVPENGWQKIEVRALDPDFQLTQVQLAARTRSATILRKNLFLAATATTGHTGQFVATHRFVPRELGLKEGDVVEYLALAKDNRHSPLQNKLDPNSTISSRQYFRIVAADPNAAEPPKANEQNEDQPGQEQPDQPDRDRQDPAGQGNNEQGNDEQSNSAGDRQNEGNEQQKPSDQDQQGEAGQNQSNEQQPEQNQLNENQAGEQNGEESGGEQGDSGALESSGNEGGDSEESDVNSGAEGESQDKPSDSQEGENGGGRNPNGNQEGSNDSQDMGKQGTEQGNSGGQSNGEEQLSKETLPSSGERDGEVVERIRRHMEENGELENSDASEPPEPGGNSPENNSQGDNSESDNSTGQNSDSQGQENQVPQDGSSQDAGDAERNGSPQNTGGEKPGEENAGGNKPGEEKRGEGNSDSAGSQQSGKQSGQKQDGTSSGSANDKSQNQDGGKSDQQTGKNQSSDSSNSQQRTGSEPKDNESGSESGSKADGNETGESNSDRGVGDQDAGEGGPNESQNDSKNDSGNRDQPDPGQGGGKQKSPNASDDSGNKQDGTEQGSKNKSADSKSGEATPEGGKSSEDSGQPGDASSKQSEGKGKAGSQSKSTKNQSNQPSGNAQGDGQGANHGDGHLDSQQQADDANLEYTRKATDLVLEYLRDQQRNPDRELLDKLGWKQKDVQKFVRRWDEMKQKSGGDGSNSTKGQKELDDVLRSMGLQAPNNRLREAGARNDAQRNNRNTGRRTKVPAKLLNPFRAFQRALKSK